MEVEETGGALRGNVCHFCLFKFFLQAKFEKLVFELYKPSLILSH